MQTGLEGKPWYVGLAAGLATGLVLLGLGYWQLLSPMKKEIEAKTAELGALQTKIQEGEAAARELPRFREEVAQLELELEKLLRILPARRNTPDLLRRIRSLAEQGDFDLKRFTPGQLTDQDFYSEWPIVIDVEGSYHNLALFFDRIGRFSRIINVEDLKIAALTRPGSPHTLKATFNAVTFVYKEPEPPAEEPAPAGGSPLLQQGLQAPPGEAPPPGPAPRPGGGE
jgi:type IV pilus assembly protein PilO